MQPTATTPAPASDPFAGTILGTSSKSAPVSHALAPLPTPKVADTPVAATPAPAVSKDPFAGTLIGGTPSTPQQAPTPSKQPFSAVDKAGDSFGFSPETDTMGKNYFAYRKPGDTSTTTDLTRVATMFDPRVAQPVTKEERANPRDVKGEAAQRIIQGARPKSDNGGDEIDHRMALAIGGSNNPANMLKEPSATNQASGKYEAYLADEVSAGRMSEFEAQTLEAKAKSLPTPFTGTQLPGFWARITQTLRGAVQDAKDIFTGGDETAGGIVRNTIEGLPKAAKDVAGGLVEGYKNPSETEQKIEKETLGTGTSPIATVTKNVIKGFLRTFEPMVEGAGEDIGQAVYAKQIASKVESGEYPPEVITDLSAIQKSAPQIVGDVMNAVLGAYTPELFTDAKAAVSAKTALESLKTTIAHGTGAGLLFGVAGALASGSTDPVTIAQIVSTNIAAGAILGLITTGVLKAPKAIVDKAKEVVALHDSLPNKQGGFIRNPIAPEVETEKGSLLLVQPEKPVDIETKKVADDVKKLQGQFIDDPENYDTNLEKKVISSLDNNGYKYDASSGQDDIHISVKTEDIHDAQTKITDLAKALHTDIDIKKNPDGTVTLYHGTTPEKSEAILKNGLDEGSFLSSGTKDLVGGVNGASHYGPDIIETNVDPRKISFSATGEFYTGKDAVTSIKKHVPLSGDNVRSFKRGDTVGRMIPKKDAETLIRKATGLSQKELKVFFEDELYDKKGNVLSGEYAPSHINDFGGVVSPLIRLVEDNGFVPEKTALHEAFHAFLDLYFTKAEKAELLEKIRAQALTLPKRLLSQTEGYTKEQAVEEYAANLFMDYAHDAKSYQGPGKGFFARILAKIKELIAKKTGLQKVFDEMLSEKKGAKKETTPTKEIESKAQITPKGASLENPLEKDEDFKHVGDLINPKTSERLSDLEERGKELAQRGNELAIRQEVLDANPAADLSKYSNKRTGELPEVTGKGKSTFARKGDDIVTEKGFKDSESARDEHQKYMESKKSLAEDYKQYREDKKAFNADKKELSTTFREEQAANGKGRPAGDYDHAITEANHGVMPPEVRGGIQAPEMDLTVFKDRPAPLLNRDTMERNIEKVAGPYAKKMKEFLIDHVRDNETERVQFMNDHMLEARAKMKELKIKRNSKEDALIQMWGEGKMTEEDFKREAGPRADAIRSAATYYRNTYDDLLKKWNAFRERFGYQPVAARADYFHHFNEINWFTQNFGFLNFMKKSELPTEIAGLTRTFKPGKRFSTAELHRTGDSTKYSAIGGMGKYLDSITKQMFHIDSIQRGRALENYIRQVASAGGEKGEKLQLQNFTMNLKNYVDVQLAGKAGSLDRVMEEQFGRPVVQALRGLSHLVSSSIILGNISAAFSHLVSIPLNLSTVDKISAARAVLTTLTAPFKDAPFSVIDRQQSSFLTRRYPVENILPTNWKKAETILSFVMASADRFKSRLAVESKYNELVARDGRAGLHPKDAMAQADNYAARVIGDYSIGQKPNLMTDRAFSDFLAKFQLGVNDAASFVIHDIPKMQSREGLMSIQSGKKTGESAHALKTLSRYIQWAVFAYLSNIVLNKMRGAGKGLSPIDAGLTLLGMNDEGKDQDLLTRISLAGQDILGELPFSNILAGQFPLATALKSAWGEGKSLISNSISGNGKNAAGDAFNLAANFVPGGVQAKKTVQGVDQYKKGYTEDAKGNPTGTIDQNAPNAIRSAVFGKTSLPEATQAKTNKTGYTNTTSTKKQANNARVKPTYDKAKALIAAGKQDQADALVAALSPADYAIYKQMKTSAKAATTRAGEANMYPIVEQAHHLIMMGDTAGANKVTANLSEADYKLYLSVKKKLGY